MNSPGRRVRKSMAALAAASLVLGLSSCGDDGGEAKGITLVNEGYLTVCTHLPYKPFQFTDDGGEVVGFDVDLLQLLADDLGVDMEVVDIGWNQITSGAAFSAQKCDVGMGAMTILPERDKALEISDPYFDATQSLLVQADSGYEDLSDLEGEELGVQTDTTGQVYAEEHAEEHGYTPKVFEDSLTEFNAVKSGDIAAAINDNGVLYDYAADNTDTEVTATFNTGEQYGFAALEDDANADELIDRLNDVLAEAKKSGEYDTIYKEWFGQLPEAAGDVK
ncbi:MAG: transporter substrate-binding domain-containing protein [Nocardioidaceae bacterium]